MSDQDSAVHLAQVQEAIVTNFTQLCGDPDDAAIAHAADEALRQLDELLAQSV
jgi:hypothetical protein